MLLPWRSWRLGEIHGPLSSNDVRPSSLAQEGWWTESTLPPSPHLCAHGDLSGEHPSAQSSLRIQSVFLRGLRDLRGEDSFRVFRYSRRDKGLDDGKYVSICWIVVKIRWSVWYNMPRVAPWGRQIARRKTRIWRESSWRVPHRSRPIG